jgi:hypothetical protein
MFRVLEPARSTDRRERFADKFLVRVRPVHFGGIEERDASLMGFAQEGNALASVRGRPVVGADAHRTRSDL